MPHIIESIGSGSTKVSSFVGIFNGISPHLTVLIRSEDK